MFHYVMLYENCTLKVVKEQIQSNCNSN